MLDILYAGINTDIAKNAKVSLGIERAARIVPRDTQFKSMGGHLERVRHVKLKLFLKIACN